MHGFIINTANYSAAEGANFTINDTVNGTTVRQSKWVDWNRYVDELSFAQAFRTKLVARRLPLQHRHADRHLPQRLGRHRPARPAPARTTSVDTYVNGGALDRRIHVGNWCNQSGAGLGERPQAAPGRRHRRLRVDEAAG